VSDAGDPINFEKVDEIAALIASAIDLHREALVVECLFALNKVEADLWVLWRGSEQMRRKP